MRMRVAKCQGLFVFLLISAFLMGCSGSKKEEEASGAGDENAQTAEGDGGSATPEKKGPTQVKDVAITRDKSKEAENGICTYALSFAPAKDQDADVAARTPQKKLSYQAFSSVEDNLTTSAKLKTNGKKLREWREQAPDNGKVKVVISTKADVYVYVQAEDRDGLKGAPSEAVKVPACPAAPASGGDEGPQETPTAPGDVELGSTSDHGVGPLTTQTGQKVALPKPKPKRKDPLPPTVPRQFGDPTGVTIDLIRYGQPSFLATRRDVRPDVLNLHQEDPNGLNPRLVYLGSNRGDHLHARFVFWKDKPYLVRWPLEHEDTLKIDIVGFEDVTSENVTFNAYGMAEMLKADMDAIWERGIRSGGTLLYDFTYLPKFDKNVFPEDRRRHQIVWVPSSVVPKSNTPLALSFDMDKRYPALITDADAFVFESYFSGTFAEMGLTDAGQQTNIILYVVRQAVLRMMGLSENHSDKTPTVLKPWTSAMTSVPKKIDAHALDALDYLYGDPVFGDFMDWEGALQTIKQRGYQDPMNVDLVRAVLTQNASIMQKRNLIAAFRAPSQPAPVPMVVRPNLDYDNLFIQGPPWVAAVDTAVPVEGQVKLKCHRASGGFSAYKTMNMNDADDQRAFHEILQVMEPRSSDPGASDNRRYAFEMPGFAFSTVKTQGQNPNLQWMLEVTGGIYLSVDAGGHAVRRPESLQLFANPASNDGAFIRDDGQTALAFVRDGERSRCTKTSDKDCVEVIWREDLTGVLRHHLDLSSDPVVHKTNTIFGETQSTYTFDACFLDVPIIGFMPTPAS